MRRFLLFVLVVAVAGGAAWWQFGDRLPRRFALPRRPTARPRVSPQVTPPPSASPSGQVEPLGDTKGLVAVGGIAGAGRGAIVLVDAASGKRRYELPATGPTVVPIAWSPSGRSLAYRMLGTGGDIFRAALLADGRDVFVGPAGSTDVVWADEQRLLSVDGASLVEMRVDGAEGRRAHARDLGVCDAADCPRLTGVAVRNDGAVAVTTDAGHVVVLPTGIGSAADTSRSPDAVRCVDPHFRPGGTRLGVTCIVVPADYDPGSEDERRNHYDVNAWVVDVPTKRWVKVRTESGGHEWGAQTFPWSSDGSRYVVETYSESPCSPGFSLVDGAGKRVSESVDGSFGSFSPDGSRVVFAGNDPSECADAAGGIFVADVSLAKPKRIAEAGRVALWSPAQG